MELVLVYFQFLLYMSITGRKLNKAYWRQISDNHDLAVLALHDNLTGLPNRRGIDDMLSRSIAEAQQRGRQVAMFYVDLDGFKQINDTHTHRVGDLFLCEVAQRLAKCVEKRGVVARLGGDEFTAVITEGVSAETAKEMAGDVLRVAREPLMIEGTELACTVSIGVSLYPDDAQDADHPCCAWPIRRCMWRRRRVRTRFVSRMQSGNQGSRSADARQCVLPVSFTRFPPAFLSSRRCRLRPPFCRCDSASLGRSGERGRFYSVG